MLKYLEEHANPPEISGVSLYLYRKLGINTDPPLQFKAFMKWVEEHVEIVDKDP